MPRDLHASSRWRYRKHAVGRAEIDAESNAATYAARIVPLPVPTWARPPYAAVRDEAQAKNGAVREILEGCAAGCQHRNTDAATSRSVSLHDRPKSCDKTPKAARNI
jgi:hypothetical protein